MVVNENCLQKIIINIKTNLLTCSVWYQGPNNQMECTNIFLNQNKLWINEDKLCYESSGNTCLPNIMQR